MSALELRSRTARARRQMAASSCPSLAILHNSWSVRLAGVELIGCVINAPHTIISPRFRDLVTPAATIDERYGYRFGAAVLRCAGRLGGENDRPPIDCPVELGVIEGFDIWLGFNLVHQVGARVGSSRGRPLGSRPRIAGARQ